MSSARLLALATTCLVATPALAAPADTAAAPVASDPAPGDQQGEVVVTGERARRSSETGSKTDTPLIELPQSVTVIDQAELTRRNALSINQALTYVAGVTPNLRGNVVTRYDELRLRGFSPGVYLNGMRLLGGVYSSWQVDFHLVESVDIIKGPASVLYGNSPPGGLVNLTSKTPYAEPGLRTEIGVGNYDLLRTSIDLNQPLDADRSWQFRVIAGAEQSDGFLKFSENARYYVNPMLTFAPDDRTALTLILNYQRDPKAAAFTGVPPFGAVLPNPGGRLPVDLNISEPAYEAFDRKVKSATILFRRDLSEAFSWTTNARYLDLDLHYRNIYLSFGSPPGTVNTDFTRARRGGGGADEAFRAITIDNRIAAKFATGPVKHTVLAGVDWQNNQGNNAQEFRTGPTNNPVTNIPDFDLFNPVYGVNIPSFPLLQTRNFTKTDQVGVYLQDQLAIGGLNLIASGRYDCYEQFTLNKNLLGTAQRPVTKLSQTKFTSRLGALYAFDFGLSPFVSYSQSFEPQTGAGFDGTSFVPVTGRQYEAGLKYQPRGANALFTLSVYDLRRQNVPVSDPVNTGFSVQVGEVRVRGVELDGRGTLAPGLTLSVAGTYTDPRITKGNPPVGTGDQLAGVTGTRPLGIARLSASSFLAYDLRQAVAGPLGGLNAGAGIRYVGASEGTAQFIRNSQNITQRFESPGYTLVDAVLGYDFGALNEDWRGITFSVNAANLFDKRHVTSCFFNNACYFGASRTVIGTLRVTR